MKLTSKTFEILKNFATINQGITFREGNLLRTMSVRKTIFADVMLDETIPKEFSIYDLNEFLSVCSLIDKPLIEHHDAHMIITGENAGTGPRIAYYYSSPRVVVSPPEKRIKFSNAEIVFDLSAEMLSSLQKAAGVMRLKMLRITLGKLSAVTDNGSTANQYDVDVEMSAATEDFSVQIEIDNLKLIPAPYKVEINLKGAARFTCMDEEYEGLTYLIGLSPNQSNNE